MHGEQEELMHVGMDDVTMVIAFLDLMDLTVEEDSGQGCQKDH